MFHCHLNRVVAAALLSANGVLGTVYWLVLTFSMVIHSYTRQAPHWV